MGIIYVIFQVAHQFFTRKIYLLEACRCSRLFRHEGLGKLKMWGLEL